ncbi:MAG: hypothetical protein ACYTG6_02680 [Planctomycetota bacterium]|jgi:hypothetical protein
MAVWKVARLSRVSSVTGEAFAPDTEVVTALFGEEEESTEDKVKGTGFARKDFLVEEATPERLRGAYCVWRTRTPPAAPDRERRLDLEMAREFLVRLLDEGDEQRAPVCLALALLLIRKRRLRMLSQGDGTMEVRWPREKASFRIPAPELTEADEEALEQELQRLFDL